MPSFSNESCTRRQHVRGALGLVPGLLLLAAPGLAQNPPQKKLYCWDQNGQRVCADSLPPEALSAAREEINARSGMRTRAVERALTDEERAAQADEEARLRTEAAALETRRRTDQAMLVTFQNEDELRRVFTERIALVDNSIQTARYNVTSLRDGLVTLLQTAAQAELGGRPVPEPLGNDIRQRHGQLLYNQRLQANFESQRVALDAEIEDTMRRYRALKSGQDPAEVDGAVASTR
jgi:hypothetical protein